MRYVVTGGAGFIGNRIVRELLKQNNSVTVIDNLHTGKMDNIRDISKDIEFVKIDIRDYEELKKNINNYDGIFHEAALTLVQESFNKQNEYFQVNVKGTENIFKIALEKNIKVVFASSSSVYGDVRKIPITEDFPKNPINPYGLTKLNAEKLAQRYSKRNLEVIGLRYFNVYGIGQTGSYAGVITKFINRLKEKKILKINGDGEQIRDFIFVDDVANANIAAMKSNVKKGFFNIGTGVGTSINCLANILIDISGAEQTPIHAEPLDGDVRLSQANTILSEKNLKWKFQISLINGLKEIYPKF